MEYTIVQEYENGTLVEVTIDDKPHQTFVVCNEGELDDAVASFVESVKNPIQLTAQAAPIANQNEDLLQVIADLKARIETLEAK